MALSSIFLPKIITGINSAILPRQKAAKHPHCIRNTAFVKAQHRRNWGGICGKTYENGFDTFSCCNRLFAISSVGLFIILSSGSSLNSYTLLYFLPYITIFLKLARKLSYSCFNCLPPQSPLYINFRTSSTAALSEALSLPSSTDRLLPLYDLP